jgi:hypothetical protein
VIERELRDGLLAAVSDEPPLSFDSDALVARARRDTRRRRSLVGVGVATVAIAIAAVAVPTVLHVGPGSGTGRQAVAAANQLTSVPATTDSGPSTTGGPATPPPTSTGRADLVWPPANTRRTVYSPAEMASLTKSWTKRLDEVFSQVIGTMASTFVVQAWSVRGPSDTVGTQQAQTYVPYFFKGQSYAVHLELTAPGTAVAGPGACRVTDGCKVHAASGGAVVTVQESSVGKGMLVCTVTDYRADGSKVTVTGYNWDPTSPAMPELPVGDPPGVSQLTTLAADPELSF